MLNDIIQNTKNKKELYNLIQQLFYQEQIKLLQNLMIMNSQESIHCIDKIDILDIIAELKQHQTNNTEFII